MQSDEHGIVEAPYLVPKADLLSVCLIAPNSVQARHESSLEVARPGWAGDTWLLTHAYIHASIIHLHEPLCSRVFVASVSMW
jgi:hypothetical protein